MFDRKSSQIAKKNRINRAAETENEAISHSHQAQMLQLQRTIGNSAVQQMMQQPTINRTPDLSNYTIQRNDGTFKGQKKTPMWNQTHPLMWIKQLMKNGAHSPEGAFSILGLVVALNRGIINLSAVKPKGIGAFGLAIAPYALKKGNDYMKHLKRIQGQETEY